MGRVGKSVLQKTFPPFPNASATLTQQHFQNGIGLHSGGHDDARRKGRHTGPDAADVIANHDETASELPGGHRNAAPPGHAGGGNHTMPGQQQCFDETLFHFGIIHGLDDDVASGKQSACIAFGYVRGFLKLGLSLLSTILTLVLVLFLSPHVTRALKEYTPVDDFLESKVTEKFMPEITSEQLQSIDLTGTPLENLTAEDISKLNEMDWDVLGITADDILSVIGDIPKDVQINLIEEAPLPRFLKDQLIENNNSTIYGELGVKSFPRYVAAYASHLVLNLLSFLVTFLLAIILVKALMFAVNIIGELPVLGLANHIAGGALGLLLALVIVWIGFLIMTLAYTTEAGSACFEMVEKSSILRFLYETNPLLIRLLKF